MEALYGSLLAFFESTFIFASLLILHGLKKFIGRAGLYVALGTVFVFIHLTDAAGLQIYTGIRGFDFALSTHVLLLPFLAMLMVIYVADGTLAAQRLIIGLLAALGIFAYVASISGAQFIWTGGYAAGGTFKFMMDGTLSNMASGVISLTVELFLIPILFQSLNNLKCRPTVSMAGALLIAQALDLVMFNAVSRWGEPAWWTGISSFYISRAFFSVWLGFLAGMYLSRLNVVNPPGGRPTLDIVFAFFGSYGRTQELEKTLQYAEQRYRVIFNNAADLFAVITPDGRVVEFNYAARRLLGITEKGGEAGRSFLELTGIKESDWKCTPETGPVSISVAVPSCGRSVDVLLTPVRLGDDVVIIATGRDLTEKIAHEREKEEWRTRTFHNMRLEAIGRLAGGIAHDFNNFLHAIQGHLDIIKYIHPSDDPDVVRHLDKVDSITVKASELTSNLLGFARKGNYSETSISPAELISTTLELFVPDASSVPVPVKSISPACSDVKIAGDAVRLQQVLLNVLINARDAVNSVTGGDREITVSLDLADETFPYGLMPPDEAKYDRSRKYCCISICDSGPGIPPDVKIHIFEPFFTTKPVGKGTGMGLSMAYGTMLAHKGWIQCESSVGQGTSFLLFFPLKEE